jgi:hypothetical protein
VDSLKLCLQQSIKSTTPNNFYNGWTHDHYFSSVLPLVLTEPFLSVATMSLDIFMTVAMIAEWGNVYSKLEAGVYERIGAIVCTVDSAL